MAAPVRAVTTAIADRGLRATALTPIAGTTVGLPAASLPRANRAERTRAVRSTAPTCAALTRARHTKADGTKAKSAARKGTTRAPVTPQPPDRIVQTSARAAPARLEKRGRPTHRVDSSRNALIRDAPATAMATVRTVVRLMADAMVRQDAAAPIRPIDRLAIA